MWIDVCHTMLNAGNQWSRQGCQIGNPIDILVCGYY
jgi:hypothetical protein